MKHYFLVAKEVGELTRIVCSALEMKQLKSLPEPRHASVAVRLEAAARNLRRTSDFRIENGRIYAVDKDVFAKDPVNFIRLFALADEQQATVLARGAASGAANLPADRRRACATTRPPTASSCGC